VNSSGPHTFDTLRDFGAGIVRLNDFYALRFQEQGIAFFSYNTRGVDIGDIPPFFATIDDEMYKTYLPSNQVQDIYYMINAIRASDERLANSRVLLLGQSEGAIIAPLAAERFPGLIDGLFLSGVPIYPLYLL
jgi:pimeloyl-ACP methyl ester carboxylesterase